MFRRTLYCCIAISFCCALGLPSTYAALQVGIATEVITPDPLLPISGGMGAPGAAREKKGELLVQAMVLAQDDVKVAFVSIDALGFPAALGDLARQQIVGIPADHILISASHTHSAPDCYAFPDGQGGHTGNLAYMKMVTQKIANAVNEASKTMRVARLRIATGNVEGRIAYNYYAPDLYDRRASVIQLLESTADTPIATLVNFAIHPEVLGANRGICSPDLIGPMRKHIADKVGGMAMFVNGAQGGMVTADNRDLDQPSDAVKGYWHDQRTWAECIRIGTTLGKEALRILAEAPIQQDPELRCISRQARFPVDSDDLWAVVQYSPLNYPHNPDRSITSQMNLLQLGTARILTIPGEAMPNIGYYLKRKMGAEHNLLFGLTNDAFGYILTKEDFNSFDRYRYISSVSLGEQTGQLLIDHANSLLGQWKKTELAD